MGRRKGKVTCRKCGIVFSGAEEWAAFEDCGNSDCSCPKVQEANKIALDTISKAKQVSSRTVIIKKEHDVPRRYGNKLTNQVDDMVYIEVPTIQTFHVTPVKYRK